MVQARPDAMGEGHVVDAALAMHPGSPEPAPVLVLGVFGDPEADLVVERHGSVDIVREAVEMVDAQGLHALVERVFLVDRRQLVHAEIEFEGHAQRIDGTQGPPLIGLLDKLGLQALGTEEVLGLVEVLLREDLEAEMAGAGLGPLLKHDAVMAALFHRPEIEPPRRLLRQLQAERVAPERLRGGKVTDRQHDMVQPHDMKGRVEDAGRDGHGSSSISFLSSFSAATSDPQPRHLVGIEGHGDVLRLHVEVEGVVAAVAPDAR